MSKRTSRPPLAPLSNAVNITMPGVDKSATKGSNTKASKKRPHTAITPSETIDISSSDADDDDDDDDNPILNYITEDCNQVRRKINRFINNGGMKVGEFQRAIGVTPRSYNDFMKQSGAHKGSGSSTYGAAFRFFKKMELRGEKLPTAASKNKKAKLEAEAKGAEKGGEKKKTRNSAKADKDAENEKWDVSNVESLPGEDSGTVEIYDSCDEIRRKIAAHLRSSGVTQASFLRAIAASFPADDNKKIAPKQLQDFQGKKGPLAGNSSAVYYGAYVYFEKLRIKNGKKMSAHREEMEEAWWAEGGVSRERVGTVVCMVGQMPWFDRTGRLHMY